MIKFPKTKLVFIIPLLFFGVFGLAKSSLAADTITVDFGVDKGTVPAYQLYMNGLQNVRGSLDKDRIRALGNTVQRAYWAIRDWAPNGVDNYNWTQQWAPYGSDQRFDDIVSMGGEIFLSLGGNQSLILPDWIRSTDTLLWCDKWNSDNTPNENGDGTPDADKHYVNSLANFKHIIKDGLTHLKAKYKDKFKYFEVQNEPGGETPCQTAAHQKLMYEQIIEAANEVNATLPEDQYPPIVVGGPGISEWGLASNGMSYLGEILDYLNTKSMQAGFISYHDYYDGSPYSGQMAKLNNYVSLMTSKGYPSDQPIFVTEDGKWADNNVNMSFSSPPCQKYTQPWSGYATDTALQAAWLMSSYVRFADSGKNVIPFQFGGPADYADNKRSILVYPCIDSRDGKVNPVYNAMLLWKEMTNGNRVSVSMPNPDNVGSVVSYSGNDLRILMYNATANAKWNADAPTITLNNLPAGFNGASFTWKKYVVDPWSNNYGNNPEADLLSLSSPNTTGSAVLSNGMQITDLGGVGLSSRMNEYSVTEYVFTKNGDCTPQAEICGNGIDEDCSGEDLACLGGINLLTNSDFGSGTSNWTFYTNGAGAFSVENGQGKIQITASGDNVQFYQSGIALDANTSYTLRFNGYSNTGHDLVVYLHKHDSPYTNYGLDNQIFDLTNSWQNFSVQFTTSGFSQSVSDARLRFWLSPYNVSGDQYFIDDVELVKTSSSDTIPPAAPSGLSVL